MISKRVCIHFIQNYFKGSTRFITTHPTHRRPKTSFFYIFPCTHPDENLRINIHRSCSRGLITRNATMVDKILTKKSTCIKYFQNLSDIIYSYSTRKWNQTLKTLHSPNTESLLPYLHINREILIPRVVSHPVEYCLKSHLFKISTAKFIVKSFPVQFLRSRDRHKTIKGTLTLERPKMGFLSFTLDFKEDLEVEKMERGCLRNWSETTPINFQQNNKGLNKKFIYFS